MAMTKQEFNYRRTMIDYLNKQGYHAYSSILLKFELKFRGSGSYFAACTYIDKGRICINPDITDKHVISVLLRHEILHNFLDHERRTIKELGKIKGIDTNSLEDATVKELKDELYSNDKFNIAADYEISNRGYTDDDKYIARNFGILAGFGQTMSALVTEDGHADWVNLSVEEMYRKLLEEQKIADEKAKDSIQNSNITGKLLSPKQFISEDGKVYGVK